MKVLINSLLCLFTSLRRYHDQTHAAVRKKQREWERVCNFKRDEGFVSRIRIKNGVILAPGTRLWTCLSEKLLEYQPAVSESQWKWSREQLKIHSWWTPLTISCLNVFFYYPVLFIMFLNTSFKICIQIMIFSMSLCWQDNVDYCHYNYK